ncbi:MULTISPECIES: sulfite exporter TauE/SafE family protein [Kribbella]|uniref:Probable membrane transporter protein n=2 Tax=Kribbella TaxID=182639 RepID=A0A4R0I5R8_9ACTN|nr:MULTISPECIES: sulfite exporter TauE/SafE family protein [Kribbella]TCC21290.1 sulfite exporter TauE/SafE family protein [Kribbella sindirgiensis]TCC37681.1 sulfite exporter TauE/SafE family protein [Kribbella speibonae]
MTWFEAVFVLLAGMGAGTINAVVGSGTLLTFPALLAVGIPPVLANVSNTVGLAPGTAAGAIGYRRELEGQRGRLFRLVPASLAGGILGGVLLLTLPDSAFHAVVPVLILLGCVLVAFQPWLSKWISVPAHQHRGAWWVIPAVFATGVYGGYFGAAQGVLLMAILGLGLDSNLQRMNGLKNVLATVVNTASAILFVIVHDIDWLAAGLIAVGSTIGGFIGARYGRKLPPIALRALIVCIGVLAIVTMVF